jgi:hypothetical protein
VWQNWYIHASLNVFVEGTITGALAKNYSSEQMLLLLMFFIRDDSNDH